MRTMLIPSLTLLACALTAGDPPAGGPGEGPGPRGGLLAIFDQADANADGKLTKDEAKAFHAGKATERTDAAAKAFAVGDADKDGGLTKDEFKVAMKSLRESMPKPPGRPEGDRKKPEGEHGPGPGDGPQKDRPDAFTRMDADQDGKVTLAEMAAARDQRKDEGKDMAEGLWKKADTDGDGALTKAEITAAMGAMKGDKKPE